MRVLARVEVRRGHLILSAAPHDWHPSAPAITGLEVNALAVQRYVGHHQRAPPQLGHDLVVNLAVVLDRVDSNRRISAGIQRRREPIPKDGEECVVLGLVHTFLGHNRAR